MLPLNLPTIKYSLTGIRVRLCDTCKNGSIFGANHSVLYRLKLKSPDHKSCDLKCHIHLEFFIFIVSFLPTFLGAD